MKKIIAIYMLLKIKSKTIPPWCISHQPMQLNALAMPYYYSDVACAHFLRKLHSKNWNVIATIFIQFPAFLFYVAIVLVSLISWLDGICKLYKQLTKQWWILLWSSSLFSTSTDAAVNPLLLLTWVKLNEPLSDKFIISWDIMWGMLLEVPECLPPTPWLQTDTIVT